MVPASNGITVPSALLQAISTRQGRVALVVGAGCSLEAPTNLKLSREYSVEVHDALIADEVLEAGECVDPGDLSLLAEVVHSKTGSQRGVVERLPCAVFRIAKANRGYLLAVALMEEGAISCIVSLNYDLAMTDALRQLEAKDVGVIRGPSALREFGAKAVIYLHSNAEEENLERWILRREALEDEWQGSWEEVVVDRVAASPALVFAGLGSDAAVLTESVRRIRTVVDDELQVFLVDPVATSPFAEALGPPDQNIVQATWCNFMDRLADRIVVEYRNVLENAVDSLCELNEWPYAEWLPQLLTAFEEAGLLAIGRIRSAWLCNQWMFAPDREESREPLAYLVLALSEVLGEQDADIRITDHGIIEVIQDGYVVGRVMGVHGRGVRRWAAAEATLGTILEGCENKPDIVIAGGMIGSQLDEISPQPDIVDDIGDDDIIRASTRPRMIDFEEIRGMGQTFFDLVA